MKKFSIYIKDTEPRHGGEFFMQKITAKNKQEATEIAEKLYGKGAFVK